MMNTYLPSDERIRIMGRTVKREPLPLFWTGSGVEFNVSGSELTFVLTSEFSLFEPWIRVEVDDYPMIRMPLQKGENRVTVYRGFTASESRKVQLFKEVQAMPDDPEAALFVDRIETDGELQELPAHELKIEFIGDSLTSGEGLAGAHHLNDWQSAVFSTHNSYTQLLAKELNAEIRVLSQSGWGVYRSFDANRAHALPPYYEQVCGVLQGDKNRALGAFESYDFSAWKPDFIFVNLGSNDKNGDTEPLTETVRADIRQAVTAFLYKLRKNNPEAKILYCSGLGENEIYPDMKQGVDDYILKTGDRGVRFIKVPAPEDAPGDIMEYMGSRNHPGPKANRMQADAIAEAIRAWLTEEGKRV